MKKFGLELVFFLVVLPLFAVFAAVYATAGLLMLIPAGMAKIGGSLRALRILLEPWRGIASMARVIWGHLRYVWLCDLRPRFHSNSGDYMLPIRRGRIERERVSTLNWWRSNVNIEPIDVATTFYLLYHAVVLSVFLVNIAVTVIGMVSVWGVHYHYGVATQPTLPPPEVKNEYAPTVADQQEAAYGPWKNRGEVFERVNQLDFRNIALISDTGTVKYSAHFEGVLDNFAPATSEKVNGVLLLESGQIGFKDQYRHAFTLNPGQVFLFENYKSQIFVFDQNGKLKAVALQEFATKEMK